MIGVDGGGYRVVGRCGNVFRVCVIGVVINDVIVVVLCLCCC